MKAWHVASVAVVLLLGGCAGALPDSGGDEARGGDAADMAAEPPSMRLQDCLEVSGVSVYDMDEYQPYGPPHPWVEADIGDDVNNASVGSAGAIAPAAPANKTGHWHTVVQCRQMGFNGTTVNGFAFGWVGIRVMPPPWDDGSIQRQYLLSAFSLPDAEPTTALARHAPATRATDAIAQWTDENVAHGLLADEHHGVYETRAPVEKVRTLGDEPIRFWIQFPVGAANDTHDHSGSAQSGYQVAAIDLYDTGDRTHWTSSDTNAYFSHTQTDMHQPLPGGYGNVAGVVYEGFDRLVTIGPAPDVRLPAAWVH